MRRLVVAAACVALVGSLSAGAWAQENKTVQGTITSIAKDSVTVKVMDEDMTFKVDSSTDVVATGGGTAMRAAQAEGMSGTPLDKLLKVGQPVEVHYAPDTMMASRIRAIAKASSQKPQMKMPSHDASGTVSEVNADSLTVKGDAGEWTFTIDDHTAVIAAGGSTHSRAAAAEGKSTPITDFVGVGDTVRVKYHEAEGAKIATEVRVRQKARG
jgi:ribosomal protein S1